MDTIYQDFANAIVLQAVKDYRLALRKLLKNPRHAATLRRKEEIAQFFRSGWFACLTALDPATLISKLDREVVA